MNSDVRIVRGVNIATLVFSVMGALIGGAFLVALLLSASSGTCFQILIFSICLFRNYRLKFFWLRSLLTANSAANSYVLILRRSEEEIRGAASFGMNIVIALAVGYLLLSVVGIAASILTLRALSTPEKLSRCFWLDCCCSGLRSGNFAQ